MIMYQTNQGEPVHVHTCIMVYICFGKWRHTVVCLCLLAGFLVARSLKTIEKFFKARFMNYGGICSPQWLLLAPSSEDKSVRSWLYYN